MMSLCWIGLDWFIKKKSSAEIFMIDSRYIGDTSFSYEILLFYNVFRIGSYAVIIYKIMLDIHYFVLASLSP